MTTDRRVERLPDLLAEMYLGPTPDYRDDVLERASRTRQRPAWTFPERWLPMDLVERRRVLVPKLPWRAIGILALIALLLAALLAAYTGSHGTLPPPFGPAKDGAIVYAKSGDIYIRDTAASAPRVLFGGATTDQAPTFSRQGDRFMFFRVLSDTDDCECEVWLANADGSGVHKLAGPYHNPTTWEWSPDGSKIVVGHDVASLSVITVIPTDGAAPTTLALGMPATSPTWRPPSGDRIAFRGGDPGGDGNVYLVRPDGTGLTQLVLPKQGILPQHDFSHGFSWSPDGRRFAYETFDRVDPAKVGPDGGGLRIHVADVDAAGKVVSDHPLAFDPQVGNELQPVWLPAGDRIVFQTRQINANGSTEDYLSVAPVPTGSASGAGTATRVGPSSTDGGGIGFEIAPDGHSLLVLFWTAQTTWRYDLDTHTAAPFDLGPLDVSSYQRLAP